MYSPSVLNQCFYVVARVCLCVPSSFLSSRLTVKHLMSPFAQLCLICSQNRLEWLGTYTEPLKHASQDKSLIYIIYCCISAAFIAF